MNKYDKHPGLCVTQTPIRAGSKNRDGSMYKLASNGGYVRVFPWREYRGKSERRAVLKARRANRELEAAA